MTVLAKERCHTLKNTDDPLVSFCLANQHTSFGEVIGNGLVLTFLEQERSGD